MSLLGEPFQETKLGALEGRLSDTKLGALEGRPMGAPVMLVGRALGAVVGSAMEPEF